MRVTAAEFSNVIKYDEQRLLCVHLTEKSRDSYIRPNLI
jgi:hypothetical protein